MKKEKMKGSKKESLRMANVLQQHFPIIRDRREVLEEIRSREDLERLFESWRERYQKEFLDYCTGVKGVKLLYDHFFKAVMNPEIMPERLEELLSLIIGEKLLAIRISRRSIRLFCLRKALGSFTSFRRNIFIT